MEAAIDGHINVWHHPLMIGATGLERVPREEVEGRFFLFRNSLLDQWTLAKVCREQIEKIWPPKDVV